jgi:DNA helicase MCM8
LTGQDLVEICSPGDVVSVSGVVRVMNYEDGNSSTAQMFYLYIEVNTLTVLSGSGTNQINSQGQAEKDHGKDCLDFSEKDLEGINRIKSYPQELKFKLLVNSLCPAIFGHEIVKAGLLLTLFGGTYNKCN